ncbi:hypothetical protein [Paraburkholderia sp. HD33-4]|uniref:hypothetical protein n=1 Tax=Paraburkholderia sp. HD33-4 TaxID=2883242 RepID=UPI001F1FD57B|nr:hypothetical protein [Paraburkholderia sp. HD33-4]
MTDDKRRLLLAELAETRAALETIWKARVCIADELPTADRERAHRLRQRDAALLEREVSPTWRLVELEFQLSVAVSR